MVGVSKVEGARLKILEFFMRLGFWVVGNCLEGIAWTGSLGGKGCRGISWLVEFWLGLKFCLGLGVVVRMVLGPRLWSKE